jgi:hypothetical protein
MALIEIDRFERQAELVPRDRMLREFVTVIGLGAIGRQVALQLAALGVPKLQLIDFDDVARTNVTTQGYSMNDIGRPKVEATADALQEIEHLLAVETIRDRFRPNQMIGSSVVCAVDFISARAAIWRSVSQRAAFWGDGRMLGETVRVLAATADRGRRHYPTTLFAQSDAQSGRCTSRSTIYAASLAASLLIHQYSRFLRGIPVDPDALFNLTAGEFVVSETVE